MDTQEDNIMDNTYSGPKYSEELTPEANTVVINEPKTGNADTFKKYALISLLFSVVYTFCLYKNYSGITHPFYMAIALGLLYWLRKKDGLNLLSSRNERKFLGVFYIVALMLLSIHKCLTTSGALLFLDAVAISLLFLSYVLYLYIDTTGWDIAGWLEGIIFTVFLPMSHLISPVADFLEWRRQKNGKMEEGKKQTITAIIIGLVCAVPLLLIVISLLSSADRVFSRLLEKIGEAITLPDNFGDIIGIICMLIVSFLAAYLIPEVLSRGEVKVKAKGEGKENPVIAITFTSLLGVVYLVFCLIQVLFLFTGSMELPSGYTYAEYAHEGFYQLLAVCILNVVMVSVCTRVFKASKVLTTILVIIAGCTYIMIASSATRMLMYIGVYHLTFLRLFVLWFLAVLCLWLAFLIIGMFVRAFPVFKACMIAITVAYVGFIYSNPDYQIAKYDLVAVHGKIDEYNSVRTYILDHLSTDAAPALVENPELLHKFDLYITSRDKDANRNYDGIRKYNFSHAKAQKLFDNVKK